MTDGEKALAVLKNIHGLVHSKGVHSPESEYVTITADWDKFTLTIETSEGHNHLGPIGREDISDEDKFSSLINDLYNHFKKEC